MQILQGLRLPTSEILTAFILALQLLSPLQSLLA